MLKHNDKICWRTTVTTRTYVKVSWMYHFVTRRAGLERSQLRIQARILYRLCKYAKFRACRLGIEFKKCLSVPSTQQVLFSWQTRSQMVVCQGSGGPPTSRQKHNYRYRELPPPLFLQHLSRTSKGSCRIPTLSRRHTGRCQLQPTPPHTTALASKESCGLWSCETACNIAPDPYLH